MFGDNFTRRWRGEMKVEMELTREWYKFNVSNRGAKYYLKWDRDMFVSIYSIKQGDELCFVIRPVIHEH